MLWIHHVQTPRGSFNVVIGNYSSQALKFQDSKEARRIMSGQTLDGRKIRVDYSITRKPHEKTPGEYMGDNSRPLPRRRSGRRSPTPPRYRRWRIAITLWSLSFRVARKIETAKNNFRGKTVATSHFVKLNLNKVCTEWGGLSVVRFWRWGFGEFRRLVGCYCSYLLPKQVRGTTQILIFKTSRPIGRPRL